MDSNCRKLGETPYRECRKQAAIYNDALGSMERAAEMLGVSVNTLSNYELGVTVPPVDIIIVMADLYRAPQLKTMYCKNECLIGRCMPVAVEAGSIDNIVIRIIKQFKESRIEGLKDKLIGIAEDGKVSEEEEKELNEICQELDEIQELVPTAQGSSCRSATWGPGRLPGCGLPICPVGSVPATGPSRLVLLSLEDEDQS